MVIGLNGQRHLELSPLDNVKALIYAWSEMRNYGRLLRWSWTSRGLVTKEEMADLHPELSEPDADDDTNFSASFREMVPEIPVLVPTLGSEMVVVAI